MSFKDSAAGMLLALTSTAVIVGGGLAGYYNMVAPEIEIHRLEDERKAIYAVLGEISSYDPIVREMKVSGKMTKVKIFKGMYEDGTIAGYAFVAVGPGFAANISMMVGVEADLVTLSGLQILEQIETPGLGNIIVLPKFTDQFKGLSTEPEITYIKNRKPETPNQIQAITGATISSVAVIEAINNYLNIVRPIIKEEG